jgi:hypothetical protein
MVGSAAVNIISGILDPSTTLRAPVSASSLWARPIKRKKEIPYREGIVKGIGSSVGITTL